MKTYMLRLQLKMVFFPFLLGICPDNAIDSLFFLTFSSLKNLALLKVNIFPKHPLYEPMQRRGKL